MKKIVRQQNYLKKLIESQGNAFLSYQTLKNWIRSNVEPLLDTPEAGVVFYRIENIQGLQGILKRLEYSEIETINFSDKSGNLIENVWAKTEFIFVMTHRYVSILIWDDNTGDKNSVRYYSLYNSKLQCEPLDILKRNSKLDLSPYIEKFNPDRRDNILLNASIRKLTENLDEMKTDVLLGYAEQNAEKLIDSDYIEKKSRIVAHEVRNQLSICDLYSEIIKKQLEENNKEGIKNSLKIINRAIKMAHNSLISIKNKEKYELIPVNLKEIVSSAVELSQVYLEDKNIEFQIENLLDVNIKADSDKLTAVIINLIKNATEAFMIEKEVLEEGKYIKIKTEILDDEVVISISNNAPGITEPEKIFNEGYTTKSIGSGLGLWICKKYIENQNAELELSRSTIDYTEFIIKYKKGG